MWHRAAARWWPAATRGVLGTAAPLSYQPLGLMQRRPERVGSRQGEGHRTPGEFPQRNPSREQRGRQKGFSDPLNERSEAPGSRAAVLLLKRAKRTGYSPGKISDSGSE